MSKTDSLHYQLCVEGAKWLHRRKHDYRKCQSKACHDPQFCRVCKFYKYVVVELTVNCAENPDVWGYDGWETAVIEVKVSHADFLADKKKWWRSQAPEDLKAGTLRWYLCPEGIIKKEELPPFWGLLYWDGKRIYPVAAPVPRERTSKADMRILNSILRREQFPEKIFNYRG